jgi:hypothetical protein
MKLIKEEETMSWCRVCGWYHLFGACPKRELPDPPFAGGEKTIAAGEPQEPPDPGPKIALDRPRPTIRLNHRGQM